jgi:hypothetical protein
MEINDALVTAITRELIRRLESGALSLEAAGFPVGKPAECSCTGAVSRSSSPPNTGQKKVISEAEIRRLCPASAGPGQVVEIGLKDMITPLAVDYIAQMRITVNRIG